ncbi:MAG: site-specific integrase [Peptococcaceae bacterium]|nr:site-specific integrase [Peptococcaceae bacterium]
MPGTDFAKHLTEYLSLYLPGQRNMSPNTIKSYRDTFRLFIMFCRDRKKIRPESLSLAMVTDKLVCEFLDWLEKERLCGTSTRNQRLAGIHAFFRYLQAKAPDGLFMFQKILHIPAKKGFHQPINYLSAEALKEVLAKPDTKTSGGRRDLALMALLYDSGARVQEIIDLSVRDIRLEEPATVKLTGKGRRTRYVPLMSKTKNIIEGYLKEQKLLGNAALLDRPVFFNRQGKKLTRAGVTHIIKKYFAKAKQDGNALFPDTVSPHVFRHTKAMHLLQANVNLIYIRDFLGHVNVTTTEIYARADAEIKRKALEQSYPQLISEDIPQWSEDKDLMNWLRDLCR